MGFERYFCFWSGLEISGTCIGTYDNSTSSYITSPNYPNNYGNDCDCRWTITALHGSITVLNFTDFDVLGYWEELSIYNASDDNAILLETLDRGSNPSEIWLPGQTTYLKFTSFKSIDGNGFRILLKTYGKQTRQNLFRRTSDLKLCFM